jgi:hypothetical protein
MRDAETGASATLCVRRSRHLMMQVTTGFEGSYTRLIGGGHTHEVLGTAWDEFVHDKTSIENTSLIVNTIKATDTSSKELTLKRNADALAHTNSSTPTNAAPNTNAQTITNTQAPNSHRHSSQP